MTRIINRELLPVWGARDPNSIQPEEIEAWVRGVASGAGRNKPAPLIDPAVAFGRPTLAGTGIPPK